MGLLLVACGSARGLRAPEGVDLRITASLVEAMTLLGD
jgi:hypothetical protein